MLTGRPGGATLDGANNGLGVGSPLNPNGWHSVGAPNFWRIDLGDLPGQPNLGNHTFGIASLTLDARNCCEGQMNGPVDLFNVVDTTTLFMAANLATVSTSLGVSPVETLAISGFAANGSTTFPYTSLAIGRSLEYRPTSFMEFRANGLENLTLGAGTGRHLGR